MLHDWVIIIPLNIWVPLKLPENSRDDMTMGQKVRCGGGYFALTDVDIVDIDVVDIDVVDIDIVYIHGYQHYRIYPLVN